MTKLIRFPEKASKVSRELLRTADAGDGRDFAMCLILERVRPRMERVDIPLYCAEHLVQYLDDVKDEEEKIAYVAGMFDRILEVYSDK
ncbi:hypothetical protein ACJJI3_12510 [Microbulbifer sp. ZKSA004]|uniref:hypothetical protein n=1 Tax=Microbulbifer sp. ZKSA004 TaxID=3243389 RepID=UPI0040391939